ncbi:hypothetical protein UACE39S_01036 [Ureibacillus acetophenoni]
MTLNAALRATYGDTLDQYKATNDEYEFRPLGTGTTATNWTLNALASGDGRTSTVKKYGSYAMRLTGDSVVNRYMGQAMEMKGKKGDPITVSGWGTTSNTSQGGNFKLRLWIIYADGTSKSYDTSFLPDIVSGEDGNWQFTKNTIIAEKDFIQAKIYAIYGERIGVGYFDNIKVEQNGAISSETYLTEGTFFESETDTLGYTTNYEYDANGNQEIETDAVGNIKSRLFDEHNRLESVSIGTGSNLIQTSYRYDTQGNLKKHINPLGFETNYIYNKINALERETDPLGKYSYYEYDGEGNIKTIERGQNSIVSSTVIFDYDVASNERSIDVNGVKYYDKTYFRNNLLKTIQMSNGDLYAYEYDTSKRLTKASSPNYLIENKYGLEKDQNNGLRTSVIETVNGQTYETNYLYDALQRLSTLTSLNGQTYQYFYNESSQPVRIQSNSATQLNDFDSNGQITSQTILAENQVQYRYGYNGIGYVTSYFDGKKTHIYTYDSANQLDTWYNGVSTVDYTYDHAGNLENPNGQSLTFNAANEVESFEYDLEGNLLNDTRLSYQWDGLGQLTQTLDLNNRKTVSYTYHPDGLRKSKTVDSMTYHYHYDGSDLIRVTDNENKTVWAFTWNNGKVVSITNSAGEEFEAITNYRGDVVQILDSTGETIANYEYDPWGNLLSEEPTDSRIQGQPIRYAGYIYDIETKLYYLKARYYNPNNGQFISLDPVRGDLDDPLTLNRYSYVSNNPVNFEDPTGTFKKPSLKDMGGSSAITKIYRNVTFSTGKGTKNNNLLTNSMKTADHHIIPAFRGKSKNYADFIKNRGIDVDNFTVTIAHGKDSHHLKFLHGQGKWNQKWMDWIDSHPNATAKDIYQFAGKMMDEYGLTGLKIHHYRK